MGQLHANRTTRADAASPRVVMGFWQFVLLRQCDAEFLFFLFLDNDARRNHHHEAGSFSTNTDVTEKTVDVWKFAQHRHALLIATFAECFDTTEQNRSAIGHAHGGVPSGYNNTYHILQSPGQVAILNEMVHDVRIVPLDGRPHVGENVRQWNGDSRGHWENETLVVETTHYSDKTTWRGFQGDGRTLRAVERFTRIDRDTIDYPSSVGMRLQPGG